MTEQDLISKIKQLNQIKPRQDWVLSVKDKIFADDYLPGKEHFSTLEILRRMILQPKMAYASLLIMLGVFVSAFGFARNSLPGDFLYSFKKITEKGQTIFVVDEGEKSKTQFVLLNKRLDELTEVARKNKVKNLAPAINEVEAGIAKAAKNLKKAKTTQTIVSEAKKIENKTTVIESLGVEIGELEFDAALIEKIKDQADILSAEELTAEQVSILEEVKQKIEEEKYAEAWEKILLINGIVIR